jgi:hypothetical protein
MPSIGNDPRPLGERIRNHPDYQTVLAGFRAGRTARLKGKAAKEHAAALARLQDAVMAGDAVMRVIRYDLDHPEVTGPHGGRGNPPGINDFYRWTVR